MNGAQRHYKYHSIRHSTFKQDCLNVTFSLAGLLRLSPNKGEPQLVPSARVIVGPRQLRFALANELHNLYWRLNRASYLAVFYRISICVVGFP